MSHDKMDSVEDVCSVEGQGSILCRARARYSAHRLAGPAGSCWAVGMQVNIGMQFVKAGRYAEAIRFLEAVITHYRLDPVQEFCAGQIAIKEELRLHESYEEQISICAQATSSRGSPYLLLFSVNGVRLRRNYRCKLLLSAPG